LSSQSAVLTGLPSVDKPWNSFYPDEVLNAPVPEGSMFSFAFKNNKDRMDKTAIDFFGNKISFTDFFLNSRELANALASHGIKKGDAVSIVSLTTPETMYLIYALNYIGAVANLIQATIKPTEILDYVHRTDSKYLFVLDKILEKYGTFEPDVPTVVLPLGRSASGIAGVVLKLTAKNYKNFISYKSFLSEKSEKAVESRESDSPAAIIYTSGSTGHPKGAVLTNRNLNSVAQQIAISGRNYLPHEKFLNVMPPFIIFGLAMMHLCTYSGMTDILALLPEKEKVQKLLVKHKPEHFVMGPAIAEIITDFEGDDLSFLIDVSGGGGYISLELERELNRVLAEKKARSIYLNGYGMTEVSSVISINHKTKFKEQSVGLPLPMTTLKIVDLNDGHELGYNQEGEILINAPSVLLGYYNDPEATEAAFQIIDGERWLRTGDIGKIDEDGFAYVTGRIKRIYTVHSADGLYYKLYPQRAEECLAQLPELDNCAVVVVEDEERDSIPVVFAVSSLGESAKELICNKLAADLPDYYTPKSVQLLDAMPVTTSQKIDYKALEALAKEL